MNPELREAIGKELYEQTLHAEWEEEYPTTKEMYMSVAEKVVEAYNRARALKVSTVRIKSIVDQEEREKE